MSGVADSARTGAVLYVFADDHGPPHVHARHRGDAWTARIRFSFVVPAVSLVSVTPLRHAPLPRVVSGLLADVRDDLTACRRAWWTIRRNTCLANAWVLKPPPTLTVPNRRTARCVQIDAADFEPGSLLLHLTFKDRTKLAIEAGSGQET